ncbi:uncharacterized protein J3D65DRAFT_620072 [Phyllosticta citribraziliensis]|uniref:Uncharacterized protein n=1 Tax=Phyllosticta citribraziliensis TaxID=989973 RepID=A0ABR1LXE2_9PEZI
MAESLLLPAVRGLGLAVELVMVFTFLFFLCLAIGTTVILLQRALFALVYFYIVAPAAQMYRRQTQRLAAWYHQTTHGWIMAMQDRRLRREMNARGTPSPQQESQQESILDSLTRPREDIAEMRMRIIRTADEKRRMREAGILTYM